MSRAVSSSSHVVIACGGTGGHLYPGLAVAQELKRSGVAVELMISPKQVDQRAVQAVDGIECTTLPAVALQAGSRLSFFGSVAASARHCIRRFRSRPPRAVLSMGGFTGAGPVIAARILGIPVFLHESNTIPGKANRLLARFASAVFVGFPAAASRFGRKAFCLGTPVRPELAVVDASECRRLLGLDPERPVVLVAGGSQGAQAVNDAVMAALPGARSMVPQWQWVHLSGPAEEARVREAYRVEGVDGVVHGFWDRMDLVLGAASAAVTRAGASSMAELAAMRVPAVLVPYPHASDNHQFQNACAFESTGAAVLIEQQDLRPEPLLAALRPMVEDAVVRARMQSALAAWHRVDAAERVARAVLGRPVHVLSTPPPGKASGEESPRKGAMVA